MSGRPFVADRGAEGRRDARWPCPVNWMLWVQAEVVAMATDRAESAGAGVGLNLLFGLPPLAARLITAVVAFVILALEQRRRRRFELAIIALLMLAGAGFACLFLAAGAEHYRQLAGLVPRLSGAGILSFAVGIIGATVTGREKRRRLLTSDKWDRIVGLGTAGLVNLAMLGVAAAPFSRPGLTRISDLGAVPSHLGILAGGGAALAFGIPFVLVPLLISRERVALLGKSSTASTSPRRSRTPAGSSRRASTASFTRAAGEARQFVQAQGRVPYLARPGGLDPQLCDLADGVVVP